MHGLPVIGWHHFDRVPGTAIEECAVWSFADALLAANAKVWINFNASERRMILIGDPKHARFDRAILDAGR
jgi:hypothetical protein